MKKLWLRRGAACLLLGVAVFSAWQRAAAARPFGRAARRGCDRAAHCVAARP